MWASSWSWSTPPWDLLLVSLWHFWELRVTAWRGLDLSRWLQPWRRPLSSCWLGLLICVQSSEGPLVWTGAERQEKPKYFLLSGSRTVCCWKHLYGRVYGLNITEVQRRMLAVFGRESPEDPNKVDLLSTSPVALGLSDRQWIIHVG